MVAGTKENEDEEDDEDNFKSVSNFDEVYLERHKSKNIIDERNEVSHFTLSRYLTFN